MSIRQLTVYYDVSKGTAYLSPDLEVSESSAPFMYYSEKVAFKLQYLNTAAATAGSFTDYYTGFAGKTLGSSAAIDNNNIFYRTAALSTPLSAGAAVTSVVTGVPDGTPRTVGTLQLTNAGGDVESVNYNGFLAGASSYTFYTADSSFVLASFTPTHNFAATNVVLVYETPLVKTVSADMTDQDTGLFVITLDAYNVSLFNAINGAASLKTGVKFEHKIYLSSGGTVNNPEFVAQFPFGFVNLIDYVGPVPPSPLSNWYTKVEVDALLAAKADKVGDDDIEITDYTKGLILYTAGGRKARVTLYDDGGVLTLYPVEIV